MTLQEAVAAYRNGMLGHWEYYEIIAPHLSPENVEPLLEIVPPDGLRMIVGWATTSNLSLIHPDPDAADVVRVHKALHVWLTRHDELADSAAKGFLL